MSPERAKQINGHHRPIVLFRPFRACEYDSRIPRAALRLPWADMFPARQADLCSTTRALPWAGIARPVGAEEDLFTSSENKVPANLQFYNPPDNSQLELENS